MEGRLYYINQINDQLAWLATRISSSSRDNRQDMNIVAETTMCGLLNRMYGWNLVNANARRQNFAGVDLVDEDACIAVQVTSTNTVAKVRHTMEEFFDKKLDEQFDRVIVLVMTHDEPTPGMKKVKFEPYFSGTEDIWNFQHLLKALEEREVSFQKEIHDYLNAELGIGTAVRKPTHLLPPVPSGSEFFLEGSRDAELDILEKALEQGRPVFIWGLGGMGKTEVAIALAKRCAPPRGVYFLRYAVPNEPDREAMFETIRRVNLSGYRLAAGEETAPEILMEKEYREKLEILRREYADTMLIIDNFDWLGKSVEMLKAERSYQEIAALTGAGVRLVFTTRYPADPSWEVGPLPERRLLELMRRSCADYEDEELLELIRAVGGHTLMVDLMAKTLEESWQTVTPAQILESLKNAALDAADFPEVTSDKDGTYAQAQIYKHLQALFNLSGLTAGARRVLAFATLLSTDGLDDMLFLGSLPAPEKKEL